MRLVETVCRDRIASGEVHGGERTDAEPEGVSRHRVDFFHRTQAFLDGERRHLEQPFEDGIDRVAVSASDTDWNFADSFVES